MFKDTPEGQTNSFTPLAQKILDMEYIFDKKFPRVQCVTPGNEFYTDRLVDAEGEKIKSSHRQDIKEIISEILNWIENAKVDITPIDESVEAGMTLSEAHNVHSNAYGYNNALSDLSSLLQETINQIT